MVNQSLEVNCREADGLGARKPTARPIIHVERIGRGSGNNDWSRSTSERERETEAEMDSQPKAGTERNERGRTCCVVHRARSPLSSATGRGLNRSVRDSLGDQGHEASYGGLEGVAEYTTEIKRRNVDGTLILPHAFHNHASRPSARYVYESQNIHKVK